MILKLGDNVTNLVDLKVGVNQIIPAGSVGIIVEISTLCTGELSLFPYEVVFEGDYDESFPCTSKEIQKDERKWII